MQLLQDVTSICLHKTIFIQKMLYMFWLFFYTTTFLGIWKCKFLKIRFKLQVFSSETALTDTENNSLWSGLCAL